MASPALLNLSNLTILSQCMAIISPYLQGPTLIYHDGSGNVDVIAKSLSESHTFVIAKVPEHPTNNQLYSTRSAILLAKSPEPMASIVRMWSLWKARSRVVIFVKNSSEVHEWIENLWKRTRAADILAVVLSEPPQYFTWFPYKPGECSNVTTIVPVNSSNLFPTKVTLPLCNCSLIAVTSPLAPYVVDEMHGSETRMFRDSAEKLGMTPAYTKLPLGQYVWTVYDKQFQPNTGLKLLYENEVDIMFSQIPMAFMIASFAEFLMPHTSDDYILFVPGPLEAARTTAIFRAFALQDWKLVIIASFLIFVTIATIPFLETGLLKPTFIPAVAIILNTPTNLTPSRALLTFTVMAYVYSMHITTAYTSSFIVFLSDPPREKPLDSLEDVVDSGLKVQVPAAYINTLNTLSSSPLIKAINQPDRILLVPQLNLSEVAEGKNCVIGLRTTYEFELNQDLYYDDLEHSRVKMLKDAIFIAFLTVYISKGHPLYEEINDSFIRLIEGGFPAHYSYLVGKPNRPKLRNLKSFGVNNVEGPFILLLSLLGLCTFTWICEWVIFWMKDLCKRKTPIGSSRKVRRVSWVLHVLTRQIKIEEKRI